jgi:hypothetical protein
MAPQRRGSSPSSASCSPTCGGLSYDGLFLAKVRSGHVDDVDDARFVQNGWRLPAPEIERTVAATGQRTDAPA